jgi:predicted PurR-regulated permease PerM
MIVRAIHLWFKKQSVPDKIRLLIILTSASALIIAIGLLSIVEVIGYRKQLTNNIATLTQVTAVNAAAATEFQDPASMPTQPIAKARRRSRPSQHNMAALLATRAC